MAGPASEAFTARAVSNHELSNEGGTGDGQAPASHRQSYQAAATAFVVLFCIVGVALWGLPFYYDFMVQQFGWTRAQVTSGNALSKAGRRPAFGFLAGWAVDRFGPRRMMMIGILMQAWLWWDWLDLKPRHVLFFLLLQRAGLCMRRPTAQQVLLTRGLIDRAEKRWLAYLGIGIGGATVP